MTSSSFSTSSRWEPPFELQRPAPREVHLSKLGLIMAGVTVFLLAGSIALGVSLVAGAKRDAERWATARAEAIPVVAEVVDTTTVRQGKQTRVRVQYRYQTNQGEQLGSQTLSPSKWREVAVGTQVRAYYQESHPKTSWLEGEEPNAPPVWLGLSAPAAAVLVVFIFAFKIRRQRLLLQEGAGAQGQVVALSKVTSKHGGTYMVTYEFKTAAGELRVGKFTAHRTSPDLGETITVIYHPEIKKLSSRYPLPLVRTQ